MLGGRECTNSGHSFSNLAHFQTCGKVWFSAVAFERKQKKRMQIKHNGGDTYTWAAIIIFSLK